jgi:saccharopine dehydrogenase-like NADP-dependent oxidoreductase
MRIAVVGGAGSMGRVTVLDAARSEGVEEVWIVDRAADAAERTRAWSGSPKVSVRTSDGLADALRGADAVVNAASHRLNLEVMRACLEVGAHYTDLGGLYHWALRQYELDAPFREAGLAAAISMGSAPGLTNMLAAAACERLDTVEAIELVDAIVPRRGWSPGEPYAPPYAADTLVDEFTEPAAVFLGGEMRFVPAGSGAKVYRLPEGEIECVYTIHSEPATLPRSYAAKGIRRVEWRLGLPPADSVRLRSFVAAGLASTEPVEVDGGAVRPRDVLVEVLRRQPAPPPDPDMVERIRAHVVGAREGRAVEIDADVVVRAPAGLGVDGGAWATGVPPSIAAQLLVRGERLGVGVAGPEAMLPVEPFFRELAGRGLELELVEAGAAG